MPDVGAVLRYVLREGIRIIHPSSSANTTGMPLSRVENSSNMEISKQTEPARHDTFAVRADMAVGASLLSGCMKLTMPRCSIVTPLDTPVVPEV